MPKTYDPKKVVLSWNGVQFTGFFDGTFITAARNTETFSLSKGADGIGTRVRARDRSARITFTLQAESLSNDILYDLAADDERDGNVVSPCQIQDLNGNTLLYADAAWLVKPADVEFGTDASGREWMLECDELVMDGGGNPDT